MDEYNKHRFFTALVLEIRVSLHLTPGGVLWISSDGHDRMEPKVNTHVQYTQTDMIRQTDGPLVPIQNDVIPRALLVNMHLIKAT